LPWLFGRVPKDWQTGVITSLTRRGTGKNANAPTTGQFLSLASLEKCMPSALKKNPAK